MPQKVSASPKKLKTVSHQNSVDEQLSINELIQEIEDSLAFATSVGKVGVKKIEKAIEALTKNLKLTEETGGKLDNQTARMLTLEPREREPLLPWKLDEINSQLDRLFNDISSLDITAGEKMRLYKHTKGRVEAEIQSLEQDFPIVPPPPESRTDYNPYPGKRKADPSNPYEWLKLHWAPWIKHFTPELERNHLFQYQLRKLDKRLYNALRTNKADIAKKHGVTLRELLPAKMDRTDADICEIAPDAETKHKLVNLAQAIRYRKF